MKDANSNKPQRILLIALLCALSFDLAARQSARVQSVELASKSADCDIASQIKWDAAKKEWTEATCTVKTQVSVPGQGTKELEQTATVKVRTRGDGHGQSVSGPKTLADAHKQRGSKDDDKKPSKSDDLSDKEYQIEVSSCEGCLLGKTFVSSDVARINSNFSELSSKIKKLADENVKVAKKEAEKAAKVAACDIDGDGKKLSGKDKLKCQVDSFDQIDDEKEQKRRLEGILTALNQRFGKASDEERAELIEMLETLSRSPNVVGDLDRRVQGTLRDFQQANQIRATGDQRRGELVQVAQALAQMSPMQRAQMGPMYLAQVRHQINSQFYMPAQGNSQSAQEHRQWQHYLQAALNVALVDPAQIVRQAQNLNDRSFLNTSDSLFTQGQTGQSLNDGRLSRSRGGYQPLTRQEQFESLQRLGLSPTGNAMADTRFGCDPQTDFHPMGPGHYPQSSRSFDPYCQQTGQAGHRPYDPNFPVQTGHDPLRDRHRPRQGLSQQQSPPIFQRTSPQSGLQATQGQGLVRGRQ